MAAISPSGKLYLTLFQGGKLRPKTKTYWEPVRVHALLAFPMDRVSRLASSDAPRAPPPRSCSGFEELTQPPQDQVAQLSTSKVPVSLWLSISLSKGDCLWYLKDAPRPGLEMGTVSAGSCTWRIVEADLAPRGRPEGSRFMLHRSGHQAAAAGRQAHGNGDRSSHGSETGRKDNPVQGTRE